jgi:hypothetical protein
MKVNEILSEVSQAEKKRLKKAQRRQQTLAPAAAPTPDPDLERKQKVAAFKQEKERRMKQKSLTPPEPEEPVTGLFDRPEFAALRAQQPEQEPAEDELYGVDFMFEPVVDRRTRTKKLYGYWTRHRIQLLGDVQRTGSYRDLGDFKGTTEEIMPLFALFKQLGQQYRQVYVLFDRRSMAQFPGLAEVHRRMEEARRITKRSKVPFGYQLNPETNELDEIIAWEVIDRRSGELS